MPLEFAPGTVVRVVPPDIPVIKTTPPLTDSNLVVPVSGPPGPPGPPGEIAGQIRLEAVAGQALSGHRIVTPRPDGLLAYASNLDLDHLHAPLWLTLGAALLGAPVDVLTYGLITESSWSWTPGPLFLGAGGFITQTPPTSPGALFIVQIGTATGPTSAWVDRRSSIRLT